MPPAPQFPADMMELKNETCEETTDKMLIVSYFHKNNDFLFCSEATAPEVTVMEAFMAVECYGLLVALLHC